MPTYEVTRPDGPEHGVVVACPEHGEQTEFRPGEKRVAFYCEGCGIELEVALHDAHDWRDMGELC